MKAAVQRRLYQGGFIKVAVPRWLYQRGCTKVAVFHMFFHS